MESMIRAVVPIVVVIVAVGLFYVAKSTFGWTLGVRTFWPAFVALFLYSYYVLSLDRETYNNKDNQQ